MPDHFEKAKDDILRRTAGNGGPSTVDILTALGALALDMDETIAASDKAAEERHDESTRAMKKHITYADKRDERIETLEMKLTQYENDCPHRLEAIIDEAVTRSRADHGATHEAHMQTHHAARRESDPKGENHREERGESDFPTGDKRTLFEVILAWGVVKWLIAGVVMAVLVWTVSYWASACAAEKVENQAIENATDIHQLISPSPIP